MTYQNTSSGPWSRSHTEISPPVRLKRHCVEHTGLEAEAVGDGRARGHGRRVCTLASRLVPSPPAMSMSIPRLRRDEIAGKAVIGEVGMLGWGVKGPGSWGYETTCLESMYSGKLALFVTANLTDGPALKTFPSKPPRLRSPHLKRSIQSLFRSRGPSTRS